MCSRRPKSTSPSDPKTPVNVTSEVLGPDPKLTVSGSSPSNGLWSSRRWACLDRSPDTYPVFLSSVSDCIGPFVDTSETFTNGSLRPRAARPTNHCEGRLSSRVHLLRRPTSNHPGQGACKPRPTLSFTLDFFVTLVHVNRSRSLPLCFGKCFKKRPIRFTRVVPRGQGNCRTTASVPMPDPGLRYLVHPEVVVYRKGLGVTVLCRNQLVDGLPILYSTDTCSLLHSPYAEGGWTFLSVLKHEEVVRGSHPSFLPEPSTKRHEVPDGSVLPWLRVSVWSLLSELNGLRVVLPPEPEPQEAILCGRRTRPSV